jgi:hypothetical protein
MISALYIICTTIVICMAIRYWCILRCQSCEYKLYREKNGSNERFNLRPWYSERGDYWGFVVYDTKKNLPYANTLGDGEGVFTIFRQKREAQELLTNVKQSFS